MTQLIRDNGCEYPYDRSNADCKNVVEAIRQNMMPVESLVGLSRSRITGEYQGQGTWLLTIYSELDPIYAPLDLPATHPGHPKSKPQQQWWLFESGEISPTRKG